MNITEVRVRRIEHDGKLRGVASITLDDDFVIHDIKIIQGDRDLFIAMPSRKSSEGDFKDIAHPITSAARDYIQKSIIEAYNKTEQHE